MLRGVSACSEVMNSLRPLVPAARMRRPRRGGRMHEHVDRLALRGQSGAPAFGGGEIGGDGVCRAALLANFIRRLRIAGRVDVDEAHAGALAGERDGNRLADVGGGAGDDGLLATEEA